MASSLLFKDRETQYAEQFCREHPVKIQPRQMYFDYPKMTIVNGESMFGPWQTWPAQRDGFMYQVASNHAGRKIDYLTLSSIIILEVPEITTRAFESQLEYNYTMETLFAAAAEGIKRGKLNNALKKRAEKVKKPWFRLRLSKEEVLEQVFKDSPLLKKLVYDFDQNFPSKYDKVANHFCQN